MSRLVIDASVVVKWFVPEVHSESALRFLNDAHTLLAPDLIHPEAGNILWKKARRGELAVDEARRIRRAIAAAPLRILAAAPLMESAFAIAVALDRSVYDSLYLALAVAEDARLVTADRRLFQALQGGAFASRLRWVEELPD